MSHSRGRGHWVLGTIEQLPCPLWGSWWACAFWVLRSCVLMLQSCAAFRSSTPFPCCSRHTFPSATIVPSSLAGFLTSLHIPTTLLHRPTDIESAIRCLRTTRGRFSAGYTALDTMPTGTGRATPYRVDKATKAISKHDTLSKGSRLPTSITTPATRSTAPDTVTPSSRKRRCSNQTMYAFCWVTDHIVLSLTSYVCRRRIMAMMEATTRNNTLTQTATTSTAHGPAGRKALRTS